MLIYINIFFIIILGMFIPKDKEVGKKLYTIFFLYIFILLILFVGFRDKVGGDWDTYLRNYEYFNLNNDFLSILFSWDFGYVLVEYILKFFGLGIYGVNFICAGLFFYGFNYFIKSFKLKYSYSLLIAFPYLIMVVANGYTRQAVAIGFAMAMYGAFYKNKKFKTILFYILALLFHKSAIIAGLIFFSKKIEIKYYIYLLFFISVIFIFIFESNYLNFYLLNPMQSKGGIARIFFYVIAGFLFFIFDKEWRTYYRNYNIIKIFSLFSFFILLFTLITKATTLGDRILLYFYPLQLIVFSKIIVLFENKKLKQLYFSFLIIINWSILLIWLNFATYRFDWIPYNNLLFKILE